MAKLGRSLITEEVVIEDVTQVRAIDADLIVVAFMVDDEIYADVFNCTDDACKEALHERAGEDIKIVAIPDTTDDADGFPEIVDVVLPTE